MVAGRGCGWPRIVYGGGPVSRRALELLHESNPLVVSVSFGAALCMVVLAALAHLPLHADESGVVGFVRETGPFRVRLLKTRQVAHIRRCTAIASSSPTVRSRFEIRRQRVVRGDVMGGWLPVLVHESQVGVRALSVLRGGLQTLGHASRGGCRLVIREDQALVTPVAI